MLVNSTTIIRGIGYFVPEQVVTNGDLERLMNTDEAFIVARTGIHERRHATPSQSLNDLILPAVAAALKHARLAGEDIDAVIVSTLSPDYHDPSQACLLQGAALRPGIPAFDVRAQCSGLLYGMELASGMLASGRYRHVLLVCAEILSKRMDCSDEGRNLAILLGDGAGALVLGRAAPGEGGVVDLVIGADGREFNLLCTAAPGSRNPTFLSVADVEQGRHHFRMQGKDMFEHASTTLARVAGQLLDAHGLSIKDIQLVIPHQPNVRLLEAVMRLLDVDPARCMVTADRLGNMASASLPVSLAIAFESGRLKPGDLALLITYGAGATWGAALYRN
ncbi:MAG: beta-ketoacyl-ACP synthase 3 [Deltaproteobacteria bacterium]